jgi:hypothetical protein
MTGDQVKELIADALEYDPSYSVEAVLNEVSEHRAELWIRERSIAITNVMEKPNVRQFHIWIVAGDLEELMNEIYPHLEHRARGLGCGIMTVSGRRGWIRKLKPHGFEEVATVGTKVL